MVNKILLMSKKVAKLSIIRMKDGGDKSKDTDLRAWLYSGANRAP